VACAGAVLVASVVRPPGAGGSATLLLGVALDKWLHAAAYAALAATLAYAALAAGRTLLVVAAVVAAYGLGIEGVQATLPYRTFSVADAAANAVGALVGVAAWRLLAVSGVRTRTARDEDGRG
jgi:VanZ family protein